MTNRHTSAAIAQLVFYAPAVPVTLYLCVRNWKHGPRLAWYPLVPFSLSTSNQDQSALIPPSCLLNKNKKPRKQKFCDTNHQKLTIHGNPVRLTGAILTIVEGQHPTDIGLIIATIVMLNIGVIPLLVTFHSVVRLVYVSSLPPPPIYPAFMYYVLFLILHLTSHPFHHTSHTKTHLYIIR